MKAIKQLLNLRTLELQVPNGMDGALALAHMMALRENAVGLKINSLAGTAIAGTLSGANLIFTSSSAIQWIHTQRLTVGAITGTMVVGEAITQATSSAAGVVLGIEEGSTTNYITIGTITVAAFNATNVVTGSTSGATATPTAVSTALVDLTGCWVFSHVSGTTTTGSFVKVLSNTAAAITTDAAMMAGSTAIIVFQDEDAVLNALDLVSMLDASNVAKAEAATTATYVMTSNDAIPVRIVIADTTSNAVLITLPDIRLVDVNQQIMIYGKDATTNSIDVQSYNAAQTLDGTDISSGGTPLADIDADDDYIIIQRQGLVWVTVQDGIS